ncbi:MAG: hypothetical protein CSA20_00715 [Deltaproteobacteria bacterium]|nr:MAG: hypothetical protein CSA20_00715 [Deltaproteobacteria bacterium]
MRSCGSAIGSHTRLCPSRFTGLVALAGELCNIYKNRWEVELFVKWLKHPLKITKNGKNIFYFQVNIAECL